MTTEKKFIIITGKPASGKSTLVARLTERLRDMGISVGGVFTPELKDKSNRRYGFEVVGISSGRRSTLAIDKNLSSTQRCYRLGRYTVFPENFAAVLQEEILSGAEVFIVDEVGPMELPSGELEESWLRMVKSNASKFCRVVLTVKKNMASALKKFIGEYFLLVDIDEVGRDLGYIYVLEKVTGTDAFLFDLDGVIVDSAEFHKRAWLAYMESKGVDFSEDDFKKTFGKTNEDILKSYFPSASEDELRRMSMDKEELYRKLAKGKIKAIEGSVELLKLIKDKNFKTALVSSTPRENIDFLFEELGLGEFFDVVVSGTDVRRGKPDPECYLLAIYKLGVKAYKTYVVEDSEHGLEAGKRAGAKCVGITTTHKDLKSADLVVDSFRVLENFIRYLF